MFPVCRQGYVRIIHRTRDSQGSNTSCFDGLPHFIGKMSFRYCAGSRRRQAIAFGLFSPPIEVAIEPPRLTDMYLFLLRLSLMNVRFIGLLMNSKYRGGALLFLKTVMKGLLQPGHFIATSLEMSGFTVDLKSAGGGVADAEENASPAPPSSSSLEGRGRFAACLACYESIWTGNVFVTTVRSCSAFTARK